MTKIVLIIMFVNPSHDIVLPMRTMKDCEEAANRIWYKEFRNEVSAMSCHVEFPND